ncbi:hypothetical protein SEMRO_569_G168410.1 [Seminavis robusta]|uniref:Uncharacterized protein n=1 Tax=Seminavis robusta TaxID=568900 RepID=A0A9N8HGC5_9STRA|nr:hypothetical protein SEMRO_569_G168410.1 [Seminavis robusta]|eukprot:Sro569_g168410.1 n/a (128) ;mRNA; r:53911-54294
MDEPDDESVLVKSFNAFSVDGVMVALDMVGYVDTGEEDGLLPSWAAPLLMLLQTPDEARGPANICIPAHVSGDSISLVGTTVDVTFVGGAKFESAPRDGEFADMSALGLTGSPLLDGALAMPAGDGA